ncbi:hypothetical protein C8J56DRAFT_1100718 [Mycena floridula]|nr:hypothetical protein C8J56DRAFT_1100718 [Mycena floridula]
MISWLSTLSKSRSSESEWTGSESSSSSSLSPSSSSNPSPSSHPDRFLRESSTESFSAPEVKAHFDLAASFGLLPDLEPVQEVEPWVAFYDPATLFDQQSQLQYPEYPVSTSYEVFYGFNQFIAPMRSYMGDLMQSMQSYITEPQQTSWTYENSYMQVPRFHDTWMGPPANGSSELPSFHQTSGTRFRSQTVSSIFLALGPQVDPSNISIIREPYMFLIILIIVHIFICILIAVHCTLLCLPTLYFYGNRTLHHNSNSM